MARPDNLYQVKLNETLQKAVSYQKDGQIQQAIECYKQLLTLDPKNAFAFLSLGLIFEKKKDYKQAIQFIFNAILVKPDWAEAHYARCLCHRSLGEIDKSILAASEGIKHAPKNAHLHQFMGEALLSKNRYGQALPYFSQACALKPSLKEAHNKLGVCYRFFLKYDEALNAFDTATKIDSNYANAWNNKGTVLASLNKHADAIKAYQRAIDADPKYSEPMNNIAVSLKKTGQMSEALRYHEKALSITPEDSISTGNYASLLKSIGRLKEAKKAYLDALKHNPNDSMTRSNFLACIHYLDGEDRKEIFEAHRAWERNIDGYKSQDRKPTLFINKTEPKKILNIGLISGNFCQHPVGFMILPLLDGAKHSDVNFYGYVSESKRIDSFTKRIKQRCAVWRNIEGMNDEEALRRIQADKIDILIDLSGHSSGSRLKIFAMRAAPVQVEWVGGLFDTSGLTQMDWILGDPIEIPKDDEKWYSERVYRLPNGYVCYEPPSYSPAVNELPALKNGYVTFGCFNNLAKMNQFTVALWADILNQVPNSRLYLRTKGLKDKGVTKQVYKQFANFGIAKERIRLEGKVEHAELLKCYNEIDIALDPHPYTGGLTTCEALWMGVPVLALSGDTFAGRHSATHLHNAELENWVTATRDEYVALALNWANNIDELTTLRQHLREQVAGSPLIDGPMFTEHFVKAMQEIWKDYCDHGTPAANRPDRSPKGAPGQPANPNKWASKLRKE